MMLGAFLYSFEKRGLDVLVTGPNGQQYQIDLANMTCSCSDYLFRGYSQHGYRCKHLAYLEV